MLLIEIENPDGVRTQSQVPDESVIGKAARSEIRLDSWRIGKEHARLFRTPAGVLLEDFGTFAGVGVNGRKIDVQYGPLKAADVIEIGPYKLRLLDAVKVADMPQAAHPQSRSSSAEYRNQRAASEIRESRLAAGQVHEKLLQERAAPVESTVAASTENFLPIVSTQPELKELEFQWRKQIHATLLDTMDLRRHDTHSMSDEMLRTETERLIRQILEAAEDEIPPELDRDMLCRQVLNEA
ncbi:MAG: FHA domain-containing protein, partial [Herminiimonas sp.]|nr:FHA domain-containing protein [Herminiimonas sp.]